MVWWRWALTAADVPVAAGVTAAVVLMRPVSGWWVWCLAALLGLPLAVRRWRPVPVLAVVLATAAATVIVGVGAEVSVYAVAFALYPVGLSSALAGHRALAASLAGVLGPGAATAIAGGPVVRVADDVESFATAGVSVAVYSAAVLVTAWALASAVRTQRRHAAQVAQLHTARAVAEERLRIARDVHDVVGHNLSLIAMKAAVATHLDTGREAALHTIEQVSRAALDDVRAVLGGLREPAAPTGPDLDRLVEQTRQAGIAVTVDAADLSSVPAAVRVSAHRILREALTNVRRHSGATRCRVAVHQAPGALRLTVHDDGAAREPAGPPGYGLLGMRERAALHGGSVHAAPDPEGGFAVRVTLPLSRPDEPGRTGSA